MGKESRKIAEREFDWEYIAGQYVEIYERIKAEVNTSRTRSG
jgi:glycosyltransferase involved in cell wall biosynthesis